MSLSATSQRLNVLSSASAGTSKTTKRKPTGRQSRLTFKLADNIQTELSFQLSPRRSARKAAGTASKAVGEQHAAHDALAVQPWLPQFSLQATPQSPSSSAHLAGPQQVHSTLQVQPPSPPPSPMLVDSRTQNGASMAADAELITSMPRIDKQSPLNMNLRSSNLAKGNVRHATCHTFTEQGQAAPLTPNTPVLKSTLRNVKAAKGRLSAAERCAVQCSIGHARADALTRKSAPRIPHIHAQSGIAGPRTPSA
jgi:hypothetical protein